VLAYDSEADLESLQSLVESLPELIGDPTRLDGLLGAENCVRAERIDDADPAFDRSLAEALLALGT
jgi:hypothetical protein